MTRGDAPLFAAMFALAAARFLYCGFTYFPQLDDYIQYHNIELASDWGLMLDQLGAFASRPLALTSDMFIWSHFWGRLIIVVLIMCALWVGSAFLFRAVMRRFFGTGRAFILLYSLLPLGIEGTYWLSASTRIVPAMFFTALSAWLLTRFAESGKRRFIPLFLAANLISMCYYEQVLVLSFSLTVLLTIMLVVKGNRRGWLGAATVICAAAYFAFTAYYSGKGMYAGRMELVLPVSAYYFKVFLPDVVSQLVRAFAAGGVLTLTRGAARGAGFIIEDGAVIFTLAVLALMAAAVFLLTRGCASAPGPRRGKNGAMYGAAACAICGVLLTAAPISIFFVLANPWISLRATVPCFLGGALLGDLALRGIGTLIRNGNARRLCAVIAAAVFTLLSVVSAAADIRDFRGQYKADTAAVGAVLSAASDDWTGKKIGILRFEATALGEQTFFYHEHITGVTESDWALHGALTCALGHDPDYTVIPLGQTDGELWRAWNRGNKLLTLFDRLYIYENGKLTALTLADCGDGLYELHYPDGRPCASVTDDGTYGHIIYEDHAS